MPDLPFSKSWVITYFIFSAGAPRSNCDTHHSECTSTSPGSPVCTHCSTLLPVCLQHPDHGTAGNALYLATVLLRFQPIKRMCESLFIWLHRHSLSTSARPSNLKTYTSLHSCGQEITLRAKSAVKYRFVLSYSVIMPVQFHLLLVT